MTAVVSRTVDTSAERVYEVLADGWSYAAWVVGASRVREVDDGWPAVGSRIHHSIGAWPVLVHDRTKVLEAEPGRMLELDVAVWFLGRGPVRFELEPLGPSSCRVTMRERMAQGVLSVPPDAWVDPFLKARNVETLGRLAAIATGRSENAGRSEQ